MSQAPLLYRFLHRLLPGHFRGRHGHAIGEELEARLAEYRRAHGTVRGFWRRASSELLRALPGLWMRSVRPRDGAGAMSSLLHDVRFAVRSLARQPTLTSMCCVALALGIGGNATVLTLTNEILLRPLPFEDSDQLVDLHVEQPGANSFVGFSYPEFEDLRSRGAEFEDIAATQGMRVRLGDRTGPVVSGMLVSANYLPTLGLAPARGRNFSAAEDEPGAAFVVVVSHGFWQRRMGGDPDVLGAEVELDGHRATIVGVMPPGYAGRFIGFPAEFWLPLGAAELLRPGSRWNDRTNQSLEMIGRLADGHAIADAEAGLNVVMSALEREYPEINRARSVSLTALTGLDSSLRAPVIGFLGVLAGLAGLVLVAACLNVGNLLLARAHSRAPEIATRMALGGARLRIVRQLLTETVVLFLLGAAGATLLTLQLTALLRRWIASMPVPLTFQFAIDGRVLALTALATLVTAILTGLQPAWRATRGDHGTVLRGARYDGSGRLRRALVAAQVAVSVVLLVAAALFLQAFRSGLRHDPGFPVTGLLSAGAELSADDHDVDDAAELFDQYLAAVRQSVTIESAALASTGPLGVARSPRAITAPGVEAPPETDAFFVDVNAVSAGYFATVGIPVRAGRAFGAADTAESGPVAMVNESLARLLWNAEAPLGRQIVLDGVELDVVGVASDTLHLIQEPRPGPVLYLPLAQHPRHLVTVLVRTAATPADVTRVLTDALAALDGSARPPQARALSELVESFLLPQRAASNVAGGLGGIGLLLALTGVYGVVSHAVVARRREIGVRMALGGSPALTRRLMLKDAVKLATLGASVGALVALAVGPLLGSFLLGISPADPVTLLAVAALMIAAATAAAYLPARRAAAIDPAITLRSE